MAFNLRNNLNSLRTKKIKHMLPTDIRNDASIQPATNNPSSINYTEQNAENNDTEHNVTTSELLNSNTANTAPTTINRNKNNLRNPFPNQ